MGNVVRIESTGGSFAAHLASPAVAGPAVVVIQEWWGLVPHVADIAERLAAEGFNAIAPDLYGGRVAKSPDEAGKLMMALDIDRSARTLGAAIDHLLAHPQTASRKAGVVGFCMGGQLALHAGCAFPDTVGAVVDFYGIHPAVKPDLAALRAPVLGLFAEKDGSVPPARAHALEADLRAAGKACEIHVFPGVSHAFFNDTRPEVYSAEAAGRAWTMLLAFFRAHLGTNT